MKLTNVIFPMSSDSIEISMSCEEPKGTTCSETAEECINTIIVQRERTTLSDHSSCRVFQTVLTLCLASGSRHSLRHPASQIHPSMDFFILKAKRAAELSEQVLESTGWIPVLFY